MKTQIALKRFNTIVVVMDIIKNLSPTPD